MSSIAGIVLRMQWRARTPAWASRFLGAISLVTTLVIAYIMGERLSTYTIVIEQVNVLQAVTILIVLIIPLISLPIAFFSTFTMLLPMERKEDEYLAAILLSYGAIAKSRIAFIVYKVVIVMTWLTLIMYFGTAGVLHSSLRLINMLSELVSWGFITYLTVLMETVVCIFIGILAALLFGRMVTALRREVALIVLVLIAVLVCVVAIVQIDVWVTGSMGIKTWLNVLLTLSRFPLYIQNSMQFSWINTALYSMGLVVISLPLFEIMAKVWADVQRHDLETQMQKIEEVSYTAPVALSSEEFDEDNSLSELTLVDRIVSLLPSPFRAIFVRDLLQIIRTPAVRVRIAMLAIALLALSATGINPLWVILFLYYAPSEIARDALLQALEDEGENFFFLQVIYPGLRGYLELRSLAGFLITFGATTLLFVIATLISKSLNNDIPDLIIRLILVGSAAWIAVVSTILCAALFIPDLQSSGKTTLTMSPATLPTVIIGLVIAITCTMIDLNYISTEHMINIAHPFAHKSLLHLAFLFIVIILTPIGLRYASYRLGLRNLR